MIITNIPENDITAKGTLPYMISDHMPTFVCIKKKRNISTFRKIKGRSYLKYNKETLQQLIQFTDWTKCYTFNNPDELWNFIKSTIEDHVNVMCPLKYMRIRTNSPPWVTQDVVEAINDRNALYKQFKRSNDPSDFRTACQARNRVNCLLQNSKTEYIKESLNIHKDDPKKFLRVLNENLLKGGKHSSDITFNKGNDEYTNITESCDYINTYFADIVKKLHAQYLMMNCCWRIM